MRVESNPRIAPLLRSANPRNCADGSCIRPLLPATAMSGAQFANDPLRSVPICPSAPSICRPRGATSLVLGSLSRLIVRYPVSQAPAITAMVCRHVDLSQRMTRGSPHTRQFHLSTEAASPPSRTCGGSPTRERARPIHLRENGDDRALSRFSTPTDPGFWRVPNRGAIRWQTVRRRGFFFPIR